jgi:hypothetical protein
MRTLPITPAVLALMLLGLDGQLRGDIVPGNKTYDTRWAAVEHAFQTAKDTRDFSNVKAELLKFVASRSQEEREPGLRWIDYHRDDLTVEERDELDLLYLRSNPDESRSIKGTIALRRLDHAPAEERSALYLTAVRNGSVKLEAIHEITRAAALGRAAVEGLQEFKPFIEQYAGEIDRVFPQHGYRRSDELLWYLEFRSGARDSRDALELHARRLAEMDGERFASLMNTDRAFRAATEVVLAQGCERKLSVPCQDLARVMIEQEELKQARPGLGTEAAGDRSGEWLDNFREMTAAVRVKMNRENADEGSRRPLPTPQ